MIDDNFNTKCNSRKTFKTKLKTILTAAKNNNLLWAKFELQLKIFSFQFFFKLSQLHFCDRQYVCIFVCIKKFIKNAAILLSGLFFQLNFMLFVSSSCFCMLAWAFKWARILPKQHKRLAHAPYYVSLFRAKRQIIMIALGLRPLHSSNIPSTDLNDVPVL